jgi:hypothetical protein
MDEDYQEMVEEYVRGFRGAYFVISVAVDGFYTVYFTRGQTHVSKANTNKLSLVESTPFTPIVEVQNKEVGIGHEDILNSIIDVGIWFEVGPEPHMMTRTRWLRHQDPKPRQSEEVELLKRKVRELTYAMRPHPKPDNTNESLEKRIKMLEEERYETYINFYQDLSRRRETEPYGEYVKPTYMPHNPIILSPSKASEMKAYDQEVSDHLAKRKRILEVIEKRDEIKSLVPEGTCLHVGTSRALKEIQEDNIPSLFELCLKTIPSNPIPGTSGRKSVVRGMTCPPNHMGPCEVKGK